MIGFAAQRLMELEIETLTGAVTVELCIPKLRKGGYTGFSGTSPDGREGADRGDPGSLYWRYFHTLG